MIDLKPVTSSDAQEIFEAWGRYPENFSYLTARVFVTVSDAEQYIEKLLPTPESLAFHMTHPDAGIVGLVKAQVIGHRAQIGYVVHQTFWGKGFATSAVRQITTILEAMPQVSRIWATCALENQGSVRVLEKCGFEREGILKKWVTYPAHDGAALDNYSYVKLPARE